MDKAELQEMLNTLTPSELRVLRYEMRGGHRCDASTSLITCCGAARCVACHIPHLKAHHDTAALHAYEKFALAQTLTWKGREYKKPLTPKVNKKRSEPSNKVVERTDLRSMADAVSEDKLEEMLAMLAARMKK